MACPLPELCTITIVRILNPTRTPSSTDPPFVTHPVQEPLSKSHDLYRTIILQAISYNAPPLTEPPKPHSFDLLCQVNQQSIPSAETGDHHTQKANSPPRQQHICPTQVTSLNPQPCNVPTNAILQLEYLQSQRQLIKTCSRKPSPGRGFIRHGIGHLQVRGAPSFESELVCKLAVLRPVSTNPPGLDHSPNR
ncbi:hypothetical protein K470DRAFT_264503 [Piedraia hortae CBS 480.64]|uniref:Uncharacterized protein n=1 Tax=Piedraia hortae CBS 480.64 TaxID=1314780 RepID=A0A6A7C058_9PEZI|nr:hypothetical protein K470DRAFT_264503 [Piedraia hortae CBS 480.64]